MGVMVQVISTDALHAEVMLQLIVPLKPPEGLTFNGIGPTEPPALTLAVEAEPKVKLKS